MIGGRYILEFYDEREVLFLDFELEQISMIDFLNRSFLLTPEYGPLVSFRNFIERLKSSRRIRNARFADFPGVVCFEWNNGIGEDVVCLGYQAWNDFISETSCLRGVENEEKTNWMKEGF